MLVRASAGIHGAALHVTEFFSSCTSYLLFYRTSQNSLFPLQAVNLMRAAAFLPHALHFLPDTDLLTDQTVGNDHVVPTVSNM